MSRIAAIDLLFHWPPLGGSVVDMKEVLTRLAREHDVRLFVPQFGGAFPRGQIEGPLPFEPASFDRILVDAPCTNTGVLRRRVEVRWRLREEDVAALAAIQRDLLERALPLLKPDGRLVYTTCSLEPEENALLVEAFAAAHGVEVVSTVEIPASRDADGGFAAVLRPRG